MDSFKIVVKHVIILIYWLYCKWGSFLSVRISTQHLKWKIHYTTIDTAKHFMGTGSKYRYSYIRSYWLPELWKQNKPGTSYLKYLHPILECIHTFLFHLIYSKLSVNTCSTRITSLSFYIVIVKYSS